MNFQQKLDGIIEHNNSLLCVGLDSDLKKLPVHLQTEKDGQYIFNKAIIDATHDIVSAYKPNTAFYEGYGTAGIEQLKKTCDYIRATYPEIPIILDAKRADIGNTNDGYVQYIFDFLGADAVTLHPYLGKEALKPFLDCKDKGCIILCKTSNPGASEFQDLTINGKPLYQLVAEKVQKEWNANNNCLLVMGATYPSEIAEVRSVAQEMTLLVPGIGVQGGDLPNTMKAGLMPNKKGLIINSSRGIIFASPNRDFAEKARQNAASLRDEVNTYRK